MYYYTETNYIDHESLRTAGGKGRDDYFEVLRRCGLECIRIPTVRKSTDISGFERVKAEIVLRKVWREALADIGEGDAIFLHSPVSEKFIGYPGVIEKLRKRGCRIVNIVFDLETFFKSDYRRLAALKHAADRRTEKRIFKASDEVICHNEKMKEKLVSIGVEPEKIICVGVMDYLRDGEITGTDRFSLDKPIVFCSNLARGKSEFVYDIAGGSIPGLRMDMYGPGYTGKESGSIRYRGVYRSDELMDIMEGSFGLVWDGTSIETCTGACGEYLRFNNPHKLSHYLAGGLPVIIWKEAALADYVVKEGCGITAGTLHEIPQLISSIKEADYIKMKENAKRVGMEMRSGTHIKKAVDESMTS